MSVFSSMPKLSKHIQRFQRYGSYAVGAGGGGGGGRGAGRGGGGLGTFRKSTWQSVDFSAGRVIFGQ